MVKDNFIPRGRDFLAKEAAAAGLRQFPKKTPEERRAIMGSDMRFKALQTMTTNTLPPKLQAEMKRHVALTLQENHFITDDALKSFPCVYIGSGGDLEYPLAIGARKIVLVDPACGLPGFKEAILSRIADLSGEKVAFNASQVSFSFDFGSGKEPVSLQLFAGKYAFDARAEDPDMPLYTLPDKIGSVLMFSLVDSNALLREADEEMCSRIIPGGAILQQAEVIKMDAATGEEQRLILGQEPR